MLESFILSILILCNSVIFTKNLYVDKTLSSSCLSNDYSIQNRNCLGSDGNGYITIQSAIDAIEKGDSIFMRGGSYQEFISIPSYKQGDETNWFTWTSYPNEWAIIDGQHAGPGGYYGNVMIKYKDGGHYRCPSYWKLSRFEVTGGGNSVSDDYGGGILFDTGHHIHFEYMYIHDNYATGPNNLAGIAFFNEDNNAGNYITIQYCHLKDNGCRNSDNCANIMLMGDYLSDFSQIDMNVAKHHILVQYNLIEGSFIGIKNAKGQQFLSLDNTGNHVQYKEYGDKIHHNIFRNMEHNAISCLSDFCQVYNNIVENSARQRGIYMGWYHGTQREPFYSMCYNNHIIGAKLHMYGATSHTYYAPPYHPHAWFYNNIIENAGPEDDGRNDFNVFFSWSFGSDSDMDWTTLKFENNLFYPRTRDENIINVLINDNDISVNDYVSRGYSQTIYTSETQGLRTTGYNMNYNFVLDSGVTVSNGGVGVPHPYLDEIEIPNYVGAINPDDDNWVSGVEGLDVNYLTLAVSGQTPSWIEQITTYECSPPCNIEKEICAGTNICKCNSQWTGIDCLIPICQPLCNSHQECKNPFQCECLEGYYGSECNESICDPVCSVNSICIEPNTCKCKQGFTNLPACDQSSGDCGESGCNNHQTCNKDNLCECLQGWEGEYCEKALCDAVQCNNHQNCTNPNICRCLIGWIGENCEKRDCTGHFGGPNCESCLVGWGGIDCRDRLDVGNWVWILPSTLVTVVLILLFVVVVMIYVCVKVKGKKPQPLSTLELDNAMPISKSEIDEGCTSEL